MDTRESCKDELSKLGFQVVVLRLPGGLAAPNQLDHLACCFVFAFDGARSYWVRPSMRSPQFSLCAITVQMQASHECGEVVTHGGLHPTLQLVSQRRGFSFSSLGACGTESFVFPGRQTFFLAGQASPPTLRGFSQPALLGPFGARWIC